MKILKNTTGSDILVSDTGINLIANSSYTVPANDYEIWAASSDVVTYIGNGSIVVNDGTFDLSKAAGIGLIQGNFIQRDFVPSIKNNNRLKVEAILTGGPTIQVTAQDQSSAYLGQKVSGEPGKIELSVLNPGGNEKLNIDIGADVFDKTVDDAGDITNIPSGNVAATTVQGAINELDSEKQAISEKGQANGYASLDGSGKVPVAQLPDTVVGSVEYKGTWNANTNTPNLVTITPDKGDYYVVNVAGSTSLGGITDWKIGDWAIYNGTAWEKVDNTDQVSSVFGRQGTVVAQSGDYNASQITNTPAGNISSTTVQAALNELDSEKEPSIASGTTAQYWRGDKTFQDLATAVRSTLLTGFSVGTKTAILATDTILQAFNKIQAYLNDMVSGPASSTDNAIARFDLTTGKLIQNSSAIVDDNGGIIAGNLIRPGSSTDATQGNIRNNTTFNELHGYEQSAWRVLGIIPQQVTADATTATTSATYGIINTMSITPTAGTYLCVFSCSAQIGDDTDGDISFFVGGTEQTITTRNVAASAAGVLGATANMKHGFFTYGIFTVNGSQQIDVRFRENGGGTLTVTKQNFLLIPISRS